MPLAAIFHRPFAEQLSYFRQKENLGTEHWDDILGLAHDRAFIVAGAMKAELLTDLRAAVDKAISQGTTLEAFRRDFAQIVAKHGWDYRGGFDWRTKVIYETNLRASYAAGRWAQLTDPKLLAVAPYWRYVHSDSVLHPRPLHLAWNGLTIRHDDPWWQTHFPPGGWGCRCRVVAVSARQLLRGQPDHAPDNGTYTYTDRWGEIHTLPRGIDYGWAHAPGAAWKPDLRRYPPELADAVEADIKSLARGGAIGTREPIPSIPLGPAVSSALSLPRSTLGARLRTVLEAIDTAHGDGELPEIEVAIAPLDERHGTYLAAVAGRAPVITVSSAATRPELTLAHEIGHFLDYEGLAEGKSAALASAELADVRRALDASGAIRTLARELGAAQGKVRTRILYLLDRREQWARAYTQWLAARSGDDALLAQLDEVRGGSHLQALSQWSDADFEEVARAIDALFRAKGWMG